LTSVIFKLRPHLTHYILPMYSHSDVEERDLCPPMTPLYTASHPNSSPAQDTRIWTWWWPPETETCCLI